MAAGRGDGAVRYNLLVWGMLLFVLLLLAVKFTEELG